MKKTSREMLKISELAHEAGTSVSTIRHYINEGLIGGPKKQSRNMAYYGREDIPRISLIKRLQEEVFLPLRLIKKLFKSHPDLSFFEYNVIVDVRKKLQKHSGLLPEMATIPLSSMITNLEISEEEIAWLEQKGVVTPETKDGEKQFNEVDFRILKALSDCRASGMSGDLGFSMDDLLPYLGMTKGLVERETAIFAERVFRKKSAGDIAEFIRRWLPAVDEVIHSLHHKFMLEMLKNIEQAARERK
ncbi:MAG: MerR family transcriptional regulator [Pseudomonadota bacterium]